MIGKMIDSGLLLKALKSSFPDTLPYDETVGIEKIRMLQGAQKVIRQIEEIVDDVSYTENP